MHLFNPKQSPISLARLQSNFVGNLKLYIALQGMKHSDCNECEVCYPSEAN